MFALRLPYDIESRLDELARQTGRSMSSFAHEAIVQKMDELEAAHRASRTFSLDEVERLVRSRAPGAVVRRESDRLIIEKPALSGLTDWLKSIEPWDEEFPDVDSGQISLDEPDIAAVADRESEGTQFQLDRPVMVLSIPAKSRHLYSESVARRWDAGTVKGRPTLFGKDIEAVPDSSMFRVTPKYEKYNPKRQSSERRFELILKEKCRTVGEYRSAVGARQANDDIAWDINHNFYCLVVPQ